MNSRSFLTVLLFLVLFSCTAPDTKEEYLSQFGNFVEKVRDNKKNYTKSDWEWADKRFKKYRYDWYLKFKGHYTLKDQITIKGLILEYNSLKKNEDFGQIVKQLFGKDLENVQKKIDEYAKKDMDKDLEELIDGATEIGDSAVKVLEDVIKTLDKTF